MKIARCLRVVLTSVAAVAAAIGLSVGAVWMYLHPKTERLNAIEYGQRHGRKLFLDVVRPAKPNGFGIIVLVSGGWKSSRAGSFRSWIVAPLLRRGYTLFAVYHVSQPDATVMEIVEDVHRAVRFVRNNAGRYRIDPEHLGVAGGSAGGHLSLMLATGPQAGRADASDPVERQSSSVQAVAIFYPPTDLLNLGNSTENPGNGGPPKSFVKAFGSDSTNLTVWKVIGRNMSPIYQVTRSLPPTLIYHGDADTLVPVDQSERFQTAARKLGCPVTLVIHKGGRHGWLSMVWDIRHFAKWFDQHLRERSGRISIS